MTFECHFCKPSLARFCDLSKYHFCCAHVVGANLFYNLYLSLIHSLSSTLYFRVNKTQFYYLHQTMEIVFDLGECGFEEVCPLSSISETCKSNLLVLIKPNNWVMTKNHTSLSLSSLLLPLKHFWVVMLTRIGRMDHLFYLVYLFLKTFILITLLVNGRGAVHSVADGGLSKQADKLPRIPLCVWALLKAAEGRATKPANSGSAGTEGCFTH